MKLLIVSDLHGNWPAMQEVLRAEPRVDGVVCLGDLVNYGPHPAECVRWARSNVPAGWMVQGNHDRALGCGEDPRCSEPYRRIAAAMQEYTAGRLDPEAKGYLARLPVRSSQGVDGGLFLCHAVPSDPLYGYLQPDTDPARWETEIAVAGYPDFLFLGHTHTPFVRQFGETTVVNPGSVGQPKHGDPRAAYAVWDDGKILLRRASYDFSATNRDLRGCAASAVTEALAAVLRTGGALPQVDVA